MNALPDYLIHSRRRLCRSCTQQCDAYLAATLQHSDPVLSCPLPNPRWTSWPPSPPQSFGLGDAVAAVAQPIAKAIDAVAGTDMQHCGGCARRKERLNRLAPSLLPSPRHPPHARHDG